MSKISGIKGVFRTFWEMTKEDWHLMDRKLFRIIAAAISFLIAALFWLYFFSNVRPF